MFGFTIISKDRLKKLEDLDKHRNDDLQASLKQAYDIGYAAGRHDAVFEVFSPNQFRAAVGLDPFPVESKEWKRINRLF